MKRLLSVLLCLAFLLSLTACAGQTETSSLPGETSGESPEEASEESSEEKPEPKALLDTDLLEDPPAEFRMLKIANSLNKVYPEDTFTGYLGTLDTYAYGGIVGNVSWTSSYLESDKAWGYFEEQVTWADEAGIRFWIYDEEGYPSGAAGGIVLRDHPEYECTGLARVQKACSGGETVEITDIPSSHTARFAIAYPGTKDSNKDIEAGIDISDAITADNGLLWTAPEGEWLVELYLDKPLYEETHASGNVYRDRRYVNIMDKDAIAEFISVTYDRYYEHVGQYFGSTVEAFFTDEPSLMSVYKSDYPGTSVQDFPDEDFVRIPTVAWCDDFEEEFLARKGYDITDRMTWLFGGSSEEARQLRYDYWEVAAALIEEAYYAQIGDWCDAHGVDFSGHMLSEESLYSQVFSEGNFMRNYSHQGICGIDLLTSGRENTFNDEAFCIKTAASANRLYNKNGVMSEDSTFSDEGLTLEELRATLAVQAALGVTQITSYYSYGEIAQEGSPEEERDDTGMMVARINYALSEGEHVSDAALYYPIESVYSEYLPTLEDWGGGASLEMGNVSDGVSSSLKILLKNQIDTDLLPEDGLLGSTVEDGILTTPGGESFRILVMPYLTMLSAEVADKLEEFAQAGLPIVLINDSSYLIATEGEDTAHVREVWDRLPTYDSVQKIASDGSLSGIAKEMIPVRDVVMEESADIVVNHMSREDGDVYFLAAYTDTDYSGKVTFRAEGDVLMIDPLTGEQTAPEYTANGDGTTTVTLNLPDCGSCILTFAK